METTSYRNSNRRPNRICFRRLIVGSLTIFAASYSQLCADIPWPEVVQRLSYENEKLARRPQGHNGEYFVVCTLYYTPKESGFTFQRGFDATPITAHSEKEHAAGHYKGGFGFNPLLVSCGREILAGILRPGNAGANNSEDHLSVLELALEQLPQSALDGELLARSDSAGASHDFAFACRETRIRFSLGYAMHAPVREAILALPEQAWEPAINADGKAREGAWVTELTGQVNLEGWPEGTRLICRRERPHPGAQLSFSDLEGHRFQCFITDQDGKDIAVLEALHRAHAEVEDRVKALKATGAAHLPFHSFQANAAWLELALLAHDIMLFTQLLTLDGEHRICEPKRLRYRILHVAGQLTSHARQTTLHLPADWPWAGAILRAFKRLRALPAYG